MKLRDLAKDPNRLLDYIVGIALIIACVVVVAVVVYGLLL